MRSNTVCSTAPHSAVCNETWTFTSLAITDENRRSNKRLLVKRPRCQDTQSVSTPVWCSHSRMLEGIQYFSQLADVYCVQSLSDVVSEYPDALSSPAPATTHRPRYVSSKIPLHTQTTVYTVTSRSYNWARNRKTSNFYHMHGQTEESVSEWVCRV